MDIANYLEKNVNKTEDIQELISLFLERGKYKFGSLFWKKKTTIYELIDCVPSKCNEECFFSPYQHITNIMISNCKDNTYGYHAEYKIDNIIIIPIHVHNDVIGVLCLGNKSTPIRDEDIKQYGDLITLCQLIVNKIKLIGDYKKIYSDSTYFSKDLFLANMSHEIRTPLNGIVGFNQLLMQTRLNSTQRGYLVSMNQCSIQLMKIINDIIDFSKLSSGNMKVSQECFSIQNLINNIHETMKSRLGNKKQRFMYVIDVDVPEFIISDQQKITQIIINLVSNAINYTHIGGDIKVMVSNNDYTLKISVQDNGIGISEQDQCKLFNSFMQIENSLTKCGTGLGLAISKRLVELLNGTIHVKSNIGCGSTFWFTCNYFPQKVVEQNLEKEIEDLQDKYILIVDDNPDNRMFLEDLVLEWHMKPIVCASAKEAIKLVSSDRYEFELGLIDICMPCMNGAELAQQIKSICPLFPLIALSSVNDFIQTTEFSAKLDKPINKLQLFYAIHKIISENIKDSAFLYNCDETQYKPSMSLLNKIPCSPKHNRNEKSSLISKSEIDKNIKILIAEDIIYNQSLLKNMLESLGYNNVSVSSDGQETIEILDAAYNIKEPYKILLLDLRMPKMDGYDVIEHIRDKGYPLPKIIVVTASVLHEDRERCKKLGVSWFINKPINLNLLRKVLVNVSIIVHNNSV